MTPDTAGSLMWLGIKLMVLLGLIIYIVFAGVIVRQEQLMSKVLEADSEKILSVLAWIHLGASIFVFLFSLFVL